MSHGSSDHDHVKVVGRGSKVHVPNRFERHHLVPDRTQLDTDSETPSSDLPVLRTEFFPDVSQSIISQNDSPDIPFRFSLNPYRGCEHGCAYCYARPTHELLGLDAGLDFETKIVVKRDAPWLLRKELCASNWVAEPLMMSGVTDAYQPVERELQLTRQCLEVLLEARQPVSIITKNVLVLRDLDLITQLAERRLAQVNLSITTLDEPLARTMEPRTATPQARLRAIRELTAAGVPVRVMVAPVIPGLTDVEIPSLLEAARQAGAVAAGYVLLRLPQSVATVFQEWLAQHFPLKQERIESLIRSTRDGCMNDSHFGSRMRGTGPYAQQIAQSFKVFAKKHGLDRRLPDLDGSLFCPPRSVSGQLRLF